ncbi:MAG: hypothetical protein ACD_43C00008G0001, partial [uncultured bacterium]
VFGFMAGYVYRDRFTNQYQKERLAEQQPDISGQILNASIEEILQPATSTEAITQPAEVYTFSGYVRAITADSITIDQPDDTTEGEDYIDFILTPDTIFVSVRNEIDDTALITKIETPITVDDISLGDIIMVYTAEDIKTASERHVNKVELFDPAATQIP